MENQQNQFPETGMEQPQFTATETVQGMEQPQFTAQPPLPEMQFTTPESQGGMTPPSGDVAQKQKMPKKKKVIMISVLAAALVLLLGGIGYGVYAFMNSTQANAVSYLEKISKAKEVSSKFKITSDLEMDSSEKITANLSVDGNFIFKRKIEKGNYFDLSGKIAIKTNNPQLKAMTDKFNKTGKFGAYLTKDLKFNWSGFGQTGSQAVTGEEKTQLEKLISGETDSQEQKDAQALRAFLLNGYQPPMTKDGNKVIFTFNKEELKKIAEKIQNNVKADTKKFEELMKKATKVKSEDLEKTIDYLKEGKLVKTLENDVFPKVENLDMKITYEEKDNKIEESTKINVNVKDDSSATKVSVKVSTELTTTYTL